MHWQTYTAAACVFVTLLIFVYRFVSPKKNRAVAMTAVVVKSECREAGLESSLPRS
jgi:hypothetical protein